MQNRSYNNNGINNMTNKGLGQWKFLSGFSSNFWGKIAFTEGFKFYFFIHRKKQKLFFNKWSESNKLISKLSFIDSF